MAEIHLQTPEPFNFRNPDDWPRWKRRFHQFREASGLAEAAASKQASTLLYCIGEEVESVLASTNATEDDRKDYARIIGKLDDFFQVRKNVIYEGARFNRRNQHRGETLEQYIMTLYSLAESCEYGPLKEEKLRVLATQGGDNPRSPSRRHPRFGTLGEAADGPRPDAGKSERGSPRAATGAQRGKRYRSLSATTSERHEPAVEPHERSQLTGEQAKRQQLATQPETSATRREVHPVRKGATPAGEMPSERCTVPQLPTGRTLQLAVPAENRVDCQRQRNC